jgi:hypothetical protein
MGLYSTYMQCCQAFCLILGLENRMCVATCRSFKSNTVFKKAQKMALMLVIQQWQKNI